MGERATMTSKGQITLPVAVRRALSLAPGDRLDVTTTEDGAVVLRKRRVWTLEELRGIVPYDGPPLSSEDIVRIVEEAREDRARAIDERRGSSE